MTAFVLPELGVRFMNQVRGCLSFQPLIKFGCSPCLNKMEDKSGSKSVMKGLCY